MSIVGSPMVLNFHTPSQAIFKVEPLSSAYNKPEVLECMTMRIASDVIG